MAQALVGNWKCVSVEGFDDFLKEIGVGFVQRKIASNVKPSLSIEYNEATGEWTFITENGLKNKTFSFKLNNEFEEEAADGKKVKAIATLDGDRMVHTQKDNGKVYCTVTRSVNSSGEQVVEFQAGNATARRVFKRV